MIMSKQELELACKAVSVKPRLQVVCVWGGEVGGGVLPAMVQLGHTLNFVCKYPVMEPFLAHAAVCRNCSS